MQPRRPQVQRAPSILTTMCPISPAPPRPVHGSPSRISAAADAGPPEDAEQRVVAGARRRARTRRRSRPARRCRRCTSQAERSVERRRRAGTSPSQPGRLRALVTRCRRSTCPGEPTPTPASAGGSSPAAAPRRAAPRSISAATSAGPPAVGVGRRAEPSTVCGVVDDDRLDLRAAEVDAAEARHRRHDRRRRAAPEPAARAAARGQTRIYPGLQRCFAAFLRAARRVIGSSE